VTKIIEATDQSFEKEVLELSAKMPVVVDLWAPWCGPCKILGPILEKIAAKYEKKVALAKVNVDENPAVSQSFQVQSIPAVYAIREKKVIDGFLGAIPEDQIEAFFERLAPEKSEAQKLAETGVSFKDEEMLKKALEIEPDNYTAILGLANIKYEQKRYDEGLSILEKIPETPEIRQLKAKLRLGDKYINPGEAEKILDELLAKVKSDPQAKEKFVDILNSLGDGDPIVPKYRKLLASALF
jgi:putative thioredoxin